ncbi:nucleobase:cation symporter-1, NCS1 family [Variovorax sp. CF079]|nr:nucleobase:cation symporter-1, NCS1 family [Variovorax sp. CF079]
MPFGHPPIPHEETPVNTAVSPGSMDLPIAGHAPHTESNALIKPGYDPALTNEDLAPLKKQTWGQYNIFAFWMSDVHSVGGYITAGSLFALGLSSWQVLVALLVGICIVQFFCNLVAKPSQLTGTPYPVICRASFGVRGANIPAIIRGLIAVAWYGIQTYLASAAFMVLALHLFPNLAPYADVKLHGFAGLSALGWLAFMVMWVLQAFVFWHGMEAIRKFIDWAGPGVYVVMTILCGWLVWKAGWSRIDLNLGGVKFQGWDALPVMLSAIALVVSYFSGPMLNFGDFSRYSKSFDAVKKGNFWGLPVNFVFFSLLTVITTAATLPVFGELITDPVHTVGKIDSTTAVVLGALTFMIATIGINIVANFVSPAFDFSNVAPQHISWRTGGMIAAVGSIFLTPWNLYNNPEVIHYTLDILGSFIGPLFGILIADFYLVRKQQVVVDDLYTLSPKGRYWYSKGYNLKAVWTMIPSALIPILCVLIPAWRGAANYAWFIGMGLGFVIYALLNRKP